MISGKKTIKGLLSLLPFVVTLQEVEQKEADLNSTEQEARAILNEKISQRKFGSGVTKQQQQQEVLRRQQAVNVLSQVSEQRRQLQTAKQQIAQYEAEKKQAEEYNYGYELGLKGQYSGQGLKQNSNTWAGFELGRKIYSGNVKATEGEALYREQIAKYNSQGLEPIYDNSGNLVGFNDVQRGFTIDISKVTTATSPETLNKLEKAGVIQIKQESNQSINQSQLPTYEDYQLVVSDASPKGNYNKVKDYFGGLSRRESAFAIVGGVAEAGISAVDFYKTVFTNPKQVAIGLKEMSIEGIRRWKTNDEAVLKEIGTTLRDRPYYSTGRVAGEIILWKAPTIIVKTSDIIRTLRLPKVATESRVAPEFLIKGQVYPKIARGESAGELLEEFRKQGYGYTASPKTFKGDIVGKGSSEFAGMYQAPKISPAFLGIAGENRRLFSWNPIETLKPSAFETTPTEFKLIPKLKYSERRVSGGFKGYKPITPRAKEIVNFFNNAKKGKSYIPFVKSEKEGIIPYNTKIIDYGKKEYFVFGGRRVPIYGFKTVSEDTIIKKGMKVTTLKEASYRYRYRVSEKGYITPYEVSSLLKSYSYKETSKKYNLGYRINSSSRNIIGSSYLSTVKSYKPVVKSYSATSRTVPSSSRAPLVSIPSYARIPRSPPRTPRAPPINPRPPRAPAPPRRMNDSSQRRIQNSMTIGFRGFVIKKGKRIYVTGVSPKGKALKGANAYAIKTLRATFGVEPTRMRATGKDVNFKPSSNLFRSYRIKKGKRIPLKDTYIQRLGKRLAFKPEVLELQAFRRAKL